jgi:hypothetical protein
VKRKVIFGTLISVLFLYLAFRKANFSEIAEIIRRTRSIHLVPAVVLTLASFYIRAMRWRHLFASVKSIPTGRLFSATMMGFMANNILPARLGELFRAHVIGRWESVSRSSALATIAMERVFDLYTMLLLFGITVVLFPLTPTVRGVGMAGLAFGVLVLGGFIALHRMGPRGVEALGRILPGRVRSRGTSLMRSFQEGLGVLREGRHLLWAGFHSLVMWTLILAVIQFCFWAMDIRVEGRPLPFASAAVVLVVMALGMMVPSGPGFVGTLQFFARKGLEVFSVDDEMALSFSIVYHATQWFPVTFVGLLYLLRENLSLRDVARTSQGDGDGSPGTPGAATDPARRREGGA